jgi:hypothetical protein
MSEVGDVRAQVRRLVLSGDNILKNRDDELRFERARLRFQQARDLAEEAGLGDLLPILDLRLADMDGTPGAAG